MTVRQFIGCLDKDKVLSGEICFKVIWMGNESNPYGGNWFFFNDQDDNPSKTIDEFCSCDGIKGCMDLNIGDLVGDEIDSDKSHFRFYIEVE